MTVTSYMDVNENFVQDAIDREPFQFQNSTNLNKFLGVLASRYDTLHKASSDMAFERLLANADGAVLDEIGAQLRVYRAGDESDDSYRNSILINALSQQGSGTRDDVVTAILRNSGDPKLIVHKGQKRFISFSVFLQCQGSVQGAKQIKNMCPVGTDLRVTVRGGGYVFAFRGYPYPEALRGFGTVGEPNDQKTGILAAEWTGSGAVTIADNNITFTGGEGTATYTGTLPAEETTGTFTVANVVGDCFINGEFAKDGMTFANVTDSIVMEAKDGASFQVTNMVLQNFIPEPIDPTEKGRFSSLVYNTETLY